MRADTAYFFMLQRDTFKIQAWESGALTFLSVEFAGFSRGLVLGITEIVTEGFQFPFFRSESVESLPPIQKRAQVQSY